jgi:HlyD family secretion protein
LTAVGAYNNAEAAISAAPQAVQIYTHNADMIQIYISDDTLVATKDGPIGPIQYRLSKIGEVLPVGGKVFTMLDEMFVCMDIFLPTDSAGQAAVGDAARIFLDALPNTPVIAALHRSTRNHPTVAKPQQISNCRKSDPLPECVRIRRSCPIVWKHIAARKFFRVIAAAMFHAEPPPTRRGDIADVRHARVGVSALQCEVRRRHAPAR